MALYDRFYAPPGVPSVEHASRSQVAKDRDRVIHSGAFRRLQRKSQIVGVQSNDFFRTRLTHTIECAQIGRAIAARVADSEQWQSVVDKREHLVDLVDAACLAHDLGHAPFGHNGEAALQDKTWEYGRRLFEGNAQSFRIATLLEAKVAPEGERSYGLNLTRTTLKAILKYPRIERPAMHDEAHPKFCIYDDADDRAVFEWLARDGNVERTWATEILDAADDIAYAVHDFEDGVWSRMIPLPLLVGSDRTAISELERRVLDDDPTFDGCSVADELGRLLDPIGGSEWSRRPFDRGRSSRAELKNFCAELIGRMIEDVVVGERFRTPVDETRRDILLLKKIAAAWMIERSDQATLRFGQRRVVEQLFDGYWREPGMLPQRDQWLRINAAGRSDDDQRVNDEVWAAKARLICDHVAGMTDLYALHVHAEMYGGGAAPNLRLV